MNRPIDDKHKTTALKFLFEANEQLTEKIDEDLLEEIYDLFAQSMDETVNVERKLTSLIQNRVL